MSEREELIERLEALTGPDRDVDRAIYRLLGCSVDDQGYWTKTIAGNPYWSERWVMDDPLKRLFYWNPAPLTGSINDAVDLVERVLPGWGWRVATCCVSDDAWLFPDFNSPIHGERLRREFREDVDWTDLTDVDLRPSGRPAIALLISMLTALDEIALRAKEA